MFILLFFHPLWANQSNSRSGELIVKLKPNLDKSFSFKNYGISQYEWLSDASRAVLVKFDEKKWSKNHLLKKFQDDSNIEFVEPNYIYSITDPAIQTSLLRNQIHHSESIMDDPLFGQLWGLNNSGQNEPSSSQPGRVGADINAFKAWSITKGSRQIKIAVIDTGVDYKHSDLKDNIWVNIQEKLGKPGVDDDGNGYVDDIHGYDFANDDGDPIDGHGHGTHCAGTIGALHNNTLGVAGVMSHVEIVAVKFLSDDGNGDSASSIKAIDYATSLNVDLMSNSWGGGEYSELLKEAIKRASDEGIIFTAAAGNSSDDNDSVAHYPASYDLPNVISVAAHTAQDSLASFSCYGRKSVHITAPGHNILSTYAGGGYKVLSGTSMATPHVSGVLGLLLSEEGRFDHDELKERLMLTSVPVVTYRGKVASGGRIDAYNLLTDFRPLRIEPNEDEWRTVLFDELWESEHPYLINQSVEKNFHVSGAQFIRLIIKKVELERYYDYLDISDGKGNVISTISGSLGPSYSEYVEGEDLNILFRSDRSITKWGYAIEGLQWQ
jgi:thermitase